MKNNYTKCPRCGGWAKIGDGTFAADGEGNFQIVSGPVWTRELVARLQGLLDYVKTKPADTQELLREVESVSPQLAAAVAPLARLKPTAFLILIIVLLIERVNLNVNLNVHLDFNQLVAQVVEIAEGNVSKQDVVQERQEQEPSPEVSRQQRRHQERQMEKKLRRSDDEFPPWFTG